MKKLIGNRRFYERVLYITIPIMIQNGITNFVSLLDNIMVGQVGTEPMSGVAIVNQLTFVYSLCIFGGLSGAGIFGAQYYGQGNQEGIRETFRFKVWIGLLILILGLSIFFTSGDTLIRLYLNDGNAESTAAALHYGQQYLWIMMIGLVPFTIVQIYSSTLRETGETLLPMKAGIAAVCVNMMFNYVLIFGKLGMPALGVAGAAIATTLARFTECIVVVVWTHCHKERNPYIKGIYRSLRVSRELIWKIICKGSPLLCNEALWSAGMAVLLQCYSVRGLNVVAGMNISNTIGNLFNIVFVSLGSAVSIIVGQLLGAGKMEEAKDTAGKLIFFSVVCCIGVGAVMALISPFFPRIYNTSDEVRYLAHWFIVVAAICMPLQAFTNATYFTLRSGGRTFITFLFDSVFVWVVSVPLAFVLSRYTDLHIILVYFCCQFMDIVKCIIGFWMVKKGIWLQNIVETTA